MYEKVEDRSEHMRSIPEKEQRWAEKQFKVQGYIYYKKWGSLVRCQCGACGTEYTAFWKESEDPFEAALQHIIKPAHNKPGKCEHCGYETKYKAAGKIRQDYMNAKGRYVIGQRMGKEEFVFRVFNVEQWMHVSGKTTYSHIEYIRIFCRPGKKAQKDYYVYDPWNDTERWIDHNIGGMRNIPQPDDAFLTPDTWRAIKQTPMFKYVPDPKDPKIKEEFLNGNNFPVIRYYEAASKYPDFEMIVKTGMWRLTNSLIWKLGSGYRKERKTYWDRLGIYKHRVKELIEAYGDGQLLKIFQLERLSGKKWSAEDINHVTHRLTRCHDSEIKTLGIVYKYTTPVKFERYIEGKIQEEGCGSFGEYIDYIRMRRAAGYDLSNEIILFPRELHRRHNEMVLEAETAKMDERKKEVLEKFPKIAEKYKKLSERYSAAAAGYIIRPAKDAAEIVTEGRILHHCVGGDMYLSSHSTGRSTILFLRDVKTPDIPYITVEIKGETIKQWYGAYDKKPNKEYFDGWLNTYTAELKKRKEENKEKKSAKTA